MKYLNKFKLLYEHQYGFRGGHNTIQPVIQFLDEVYNALNNYKFTLRIFIDLTKALDTCDTDILLEKLENYGFRGISKSWFKSCLTGRIQYTSVNGVNSTLSELTCDVPQGFVFGPYSVSFTVSVTFCITFCLHHILPTIHFAYVTLCRNLILSFFDFIIFCLCH